MAIAINNDQGREILQFFIAMPCVQRRCSVGPHDQKQLLIRSRRTQNLQRIDGVGHTATIDFETAGFKPIETFNRGTNHGETSRCLG